MSCCIDAIWCMTNRTALISALLLSMCVYGQHDTLRENFDDGTPRVVYPMLDGKYHGYCKQWWPNGQLRSEGNWINGMQEGRYISYFDNGNVQQEDWYHKGKWTRCKSYHANGSKSLFFWIGPNGYKQKSWYDNGKMLIREKHVRGQPITCMDAMTDTAVSNIHDQVCYCGDVRVFLKDSAYVDSFGNPVNVKYRFRYVEWYENGQMKSRRTYKHGRYRSKEWHENSDVVALAIDTPSLAQNPTSTAWSNPDTGLLDTRLSLADTIVQEVQIDYISESKIHYYIHVYHYGQQGIDFGFSNSGQADIDSSYYPILQTEIDKYSKEYTFYHGGPDCYIGIGINKVDPRYYLLVVDSCVSLLFVANTKLLLKE